MFEAGRGVGSEAEQRLREEVATVDLTHDQVERQIKMLCLGAETGAMYDPIWLQRMINLCRTQLDWICEP